MVILSSLLRNGGKRESGNIRRKICRLSAPGSGSTNQIAERNHVYTFCPLSRKFPTQKSYKHRLNLKSWWRTVFGCMECWWWCKSRESKIEVHCGRFAGLARSPYFIAPSLHVQSASQNSAELRMPWGWRAKLKIACTSPCTVQILHDSLSNYMTAYQITWQFLLKWECPTLITKCIIQSRPQHFVLYNENVR